MAIRNYTLPQASQSYYNSNYVDWVLRRGTKSYYWGWFMGDGRVASDSVEEETFTPLGPCVVINFGPGAGTDYYFLYGYDAFFRSIRRRYHVGIVFQEDPNVVTGHTYQPGDSFSVSMYVLTNEVRQQLWGNCYFENLIECESFGQPWHPGALWGIPYLLQDINSADLKWVDLEVFTPAQRPRSWFRDLYNSMRTPYPPTDPVPIEPTTEDYIFAYGIIDIEQKEFHVAGDGWKRSSGWSRVNPCIPGGYVSLGRYEWPIGPSYTYPVGFYRNGLLLGLLPTTPPAPEHFWEF